MSENLRAKLKFFFGQSSISLNCLDSKDRIYVTKRKKVKNDNLYELAYCIEACPRNGHTVYSLVKTTIFFDKLGQSNNLGILYKKVIHASVGLNCHNTKMQPSRRPNIVPL